MIAPALDGDILVFYSIPFVFNVLSAIDGSENVDSIFFVSVHFLQQTSSRSLHISYYVNTARRRYF